jgi:EAL domain-containing protein (putative c-di-GMP-specific phosphodiesterase class I)
MAPRTPGPPARTFRWYLESFVEGGRQLRRIALQPLPFRVGRLPDLALPLASESVSKEHAELFLRESSLYVRDLGSKNGTLVNNERVTEKTEKELHEGDILHFAQVEFRVGCQEIDEPEEQGIEPSTVSLSEMKLPQQFVEGARELPQLLEQRQVTALFQPIVSLPAINVIGYEALGRGRHPRLPEAPLELFHVAKGVGAEAELSQLFRETALELALSRTRFPLLFVNVHAAELKRPDLVRAVTEVRRTAPHLRLTLDVHEGALDDRDISIERLCAQLRQSRIGIAYDDFGAGQARLLELAEVPPDFLKFDMSFIRGIDTAPVSRRSLLISLVSVARDLLVQTVAEGVETAAEADACMRIGFTHAQGFFFGRPRPIGEL